MSVLEILGLILLAAIAIPFAAGITLDVIQLYRETFPKKRRKK